MSADMNPSAEQRQIVEAVQDVLEGNFSRGRFRTARPVGGFDREQIAEVAALGWMGLGLDEAAGGAGFTIVEDTLLFRELGKNLVTPNVMGGALAAHLASALGREDAAAGFIGGEAVVSVGHRLASGSDGSDPAYAFYDAETSTHLLSWDGDGMTCGPRASLSQEEAVTCMDRTLSMVRGELGGQHGLALSGDAAKPLVQRAELFIAAQLLGAAIAATELAVEYAKVREQFGQPIGGFQAIKHRCADMQVRARLLDSLVVMAALSVFEQRSDADLQVTSAAMLARDYALENAAACIQIHGAMGFTAECDARLFLLRSHLLKEMGIDAPERERAVSDLPLDRAV